MLRYLCENRLALDLSDDFRLLRVEEIDRNLEIEPVLWRRAKRVAKAQGHLGCYIAAPVQQLVEARAVNAEEPLQLCPALQVKWF